MTRRRRDLALFGIALALRLAHLAAVRPGPLFRYLFIDSRFYDDVGRRLAAGEGFPDGPFFMNVLYGAFLGVVYAATGSGDAGRTAALLVQVLAGAVAVVLLARIGDALGRPREGVAAAVVLAAFGPAIFYDAALLTPSLLLLLTTAATLVAIRADAAQAAAAAGADRTTLRGPVALGALTGLLILGRASHVLLLAGWAALFLRRGRRGVGPAVATCAAAALVVLPVTVRNFVVSAEFVPVTANGGMALWAGNYEAATGIYSEPEFLSNPVPEREAEDYRREASRRAGRELTLAGSSAFWTRATLARWAAHPGTALRLTARKAALYFHATEAQTNLSYYFARDFSPVLDVLRLHLGWVLPFALLGFVSDLRALRIPAMPIAASLLTCVLFYVSSEYRHPVVPCLLLFAVAGARRAAALLRGGRAARRVLVAAGILALFVATNARDAFLARLQSRRVDYVNFATLAVDAGRLGEAERFARRAVALDPAWAVSRRKLAEILQAQGRVREAGDEGRTADALEGRTPPARLDEGLALFRAGRYEEARDAFLAAAEEGGAARALALNDAGLCAIRLSRFAEAESLLEASRRADPSYASPLIHLGRLAWTRGDRETAAARAREALALAPEDGRARRLLARATAEGPPPDADPDPDATGDEAE